MKELHFFDIFEIEAESDVICLKVRDVKTKQTVPWVYLACAKLGG
jgi:hypothetical protein